jgi:hypothetical protein
LSVVVGLLERDRADCRTQPFAVDAECDQESMDAHLPEYISRETTTRLAAQPIGRFTFTFTLFFAILSVKMDYIFYRSHAAVGGAAHCW